MSDLPTPPQLTAMAVTVAREAVTLVRRSIGAARPTTSKSSDTDVVTSTDLESEDLVRRRLVELTPGCTVHGEEGGTSQGSSGVGWIVDPIDGTVNFLYDLPVVAVSIAATLHGEVVAGVVADVLRDEIFSAHVGGGAYRDGAPVTAASPVSLSQALIATGFSYDAERRGEQGRVVARLLSQARDVRCFGSAALQLAWVACGRMDAFYQTEVQRWDVAAAALIAAEGGARVRHPAHPGDLILASAPRVFDEVSAVVGDGRT